MMFKLSFLSSGGVFKLASESFCYNPFVLGNFLAIKYDMFLTYLVHFRSRSGVDSFWVGGGGEGGAGCWFLLVVNGIEIPKSRIYNPHCCCVGHVSSLFGAQR